jgi:hypothetical protein
MNSNPISNQKSNQNEILTDILNFFEKINISFNKDGNGNTNKNAITTNATKTKNIIKKLFLLSFNKNYNNNNNNNVTNKNILDIYTKLNEEIKYALEKIKNKDGNKGWIYCSKSCNGILKLFKNDINSTLYMLNIISCSLVAINKEESSVIFIFNGDIKELTGLWEKDKTKFKLKIYNSKNSNSNSNSNTKTRLIMGLGPSASGKTYSAVKIISMLSNNDPTFPKEFLSIDGGTYREKSYIYQRIIKLIGEYKFKGLKNLVLSGIKFKISKNNFSIKQRISLFDSSIVKKKVIEYLVENGEKISLYVPDTLGSCVLASCKSTYKKYIDISNDKDNWIGLLIWQHKNHGDCDYTEAYKCKGCTESGTKREKEEGKIYSSSAWENSMRNGKYIMMLAPGGKYEIHNGGSFTYINNKGNKETSKSVIINHSPDKPLGKTPPLGYVFQTPTNKNLKNESKKSIDNMVIFKSNIKYNIKSNHSIYIRDKSAVQITNNK